MLGCRGAVIGQKEPSRPSDFDSIMEGQSRGDWTPDCSRDVCGVRPPGAVLVPSAVLSVVVVHCTLNKPWRPFAWANFARGGGGAWTHGTQNRAERRTDGQHGNGVRGWKTTRSSSINQSAVPAFWSRDGRSESRRRAAAAAGSLS